MGFYARVILPRLMDLSMASPVISRYRQMVLADVQGEVLEIGFGSGLNLSYYPEHLQRLVTVDANPGMNRLAEKRIQRVLRDRSTPLAIDNQVLNGENLPMADQSFDTVVSTWTLCSIAQVEQALREIHRVLKPGGKFHFIEHGLSPDPGIQVWQNRLTPIQKVLADGCHLNRNMQQLIAAQFQTVELQTFYGDGWPKVVGYLYQGVATK